MQSLYDARVSDLGPGDLVVVECGCGHTETLTASMLTTAGVAPYAKVQDLGPRLRCRQCDGGGVGEVGELSAPSRHRHKI